MKCLVHLDMDPMPKSFPSADEAFEFVENYLKKHAEGLRPRWRKDELYPNNFIEYTKSEVLNELRSEGEVHLQLVGLEDSDVVMGEIATITTEEKYKKQAAEAEEHLAKIVELLDFDEPDNLSAQGNAEFVKSVPTKKNRIKRKKK